MLQGNVSDGRDVEEAGKQVRQLGGEDIEQGHAAVQPGQRSLTPQQLSAGQKAGRSLGASAPAPRWTEPQASQGKDHNSGFSSGPRSVLQVSHSRLGKKGTFSYVCFFPTQKSLWKK